MFCSGVRYWDRLLSSPRHSRGSVMGKWDTGTPRQVRLFRAQVLAYLRPDTHNTTHDRDSTPEIIVRGVGIYVPGRRWGRDGRPTGDTTQWVLKYAPLCALLRLHRHWVSTRDKSPQVSLLVEHVTLLLHHQGNQYESEWIRRIRVS